MKKRVLVVILVLFSFILPGKARSSEKISFFAESVREIMTFGYWNGDQNIPNIETLTRLLNNEKLKGDKKAFKNASDVFFKRCEKDYSRAILRCYWTYFDFFKAGQMCRRGELTRLSPQSDYQGNLLNCQDLKSTLKNH
jgi:hypothetical protein